ncbi:hypothetical protein WG68_02425 [Arsukibacterium ikkense]|uniref:Uncharacterized protein n=1 Tax=Arsukibacterium ikkense TaxID=336831 RepID=A0A0M2V883_9GAMM|nr:hypothetical protein [Arsukibacterium ikkense]KKO46821.1 hypothetical protein WG68_02425 [Arsukibacterium ikkense]
MMLRNALLASTACTIMMFSGVVLAQDNMHANADFAAQLTATPQNAQQLIAEQVTAAQGDQAALDAVLTSAVNAGIDASTVAQIAADSKTALPTAATVRRNNAVTPANLPTPGGPGFGGGGGGGGNTISGN